MGKRTPRSSVLTRLGRTVERAAAVLFARSDARARAAGWQVAGAGRWNTARVYHDPRYDRLANRAGRHAGGAYERAGCQRVGRRVRVGGSWVDPGRVRSPR